MNADRRLDAISELHDDPARCAQFAGLRHVQADEPGIRRVRRGRGFSYVDARGRPVSDGQVARIADLAIPPAWRDVWICADEQGHLLATGEDDRGRRQYLYHPRWRELRDLLNFYRLVVFAEGLPRIRAHVSAQLRRRTLDRDRVLAAMLRVIDVSAMRVGSEVYAEDSDSFGLTTLGKRHVRVLPAASSSPSRPSRVVACGSAWPTEPSHASSASCCGIAVGCSSQSTGRPSTQPRSTPCWPSSPANTSRRRSSGPGAGRSPRSATCASRSTASAARSGSRSARSTRRPRCSATPGPSLVPTTSIRTCWRHSRTGGSTNTSTPAPPAAPISWTATNARCWPACTFFSNANLISSLDHCVERLLQRARLGRIVRRGLLQLEHSVAEFLQLLAAEPGAHLGEPVLLLLVHVVRDALDQDHGLGVETVVVRPQGREFGTQHVGDVVLLVGLQHVLAQVGQQCADLRVHALVLDVGVHRQRLDDLVDDAGLTLRRALAGRLEPAEQGAHFLVVLLEQDDRVG